MSKFTSNRLYELRLRQFFGSPSLYIDSNDKHEEYIVFYFGLEGGHLKEIELVNAINKDLRITSLLQEHNMKLFHEIKGWKLMLIENDFEATLLLLRLYLEGVSHATYTR